MINNLQNLYRTIESNDFRFNAFAINTLHSFTAYINSIDVVRDMLDSTTVSANDDAKDIAARILDLLETGPATHMHPYDAAVAAYLYILNAISKAEFAKLDSEIVIAPNLWWAKQMYATLSKSNGVSTEVTKVRLSTSGRIATTTYGNIMPSNSATEQEVSYLR